jgi:glycosyltransferase involved in cell wall biosynthesis
VIAYNRGSVSEIVVDGVTGFIVDPHAAGVAGLTNAMGLVSNISRHACRKHIEDHFSASIMTNNYELLYKKMLGM